jgi:alpha-tubulin suppressor-like RCC1 family protein
VKRLFYFVINCISISCIVFANFFAEFCKAARNNSTLKQIIMCRKNFIIRSLAFSLIIFTGLFELSAQNLSISGGNGHSIMLCSNGSVYTMGYNGNGQLGIGSTTSSIVPVRVVKGSQPISMNDGTYLKSIRQVDAGSGAHNVALACDSTVYAWGWNSQGQVGDNTNVDKNVPAHVLTGLQAHPSGFLKGVIQVTAGNESSYALMSDGRVMSWGRNVNGDLGDGTTTQRTTPVYVKINSTTQLTNVVQVEGGDATGAALRVDGTVWMWGFNGNGQLGQNNTTSLSYATQVFMDAARTLPLTNIISISSGDTHVLALAADGTLWTWGGNWAGQLGINNGGANSLLPAVVQLSATGPAISGVTSISAGNRHSIAVMNDGTLKTWGGTGGGPAYLGQTGTGAGTSYPTTVPGLSNIVEASDGDNWTFAVNNTGTIYAFGENTANGDLGLNSTAATIPTPTAIPSLPCEVLQPCVDAYLGSNIVLCNPASTTLYAPVSASTVQYRWKKDGVMLSDTSSSLFVNVAGTYRLLMWDSSYTNGCGYCPVDSDEVVVSNTSPVIGNNVGICPNPCSTVNLSVTGPGGTNYDWYSDQYGGSPLNGSPSDIFTTPCLSTATTYWVQDRSVQRCNAGYSYNTAPLSSSSSATSTNTAAKMTFDVLTAFTLDTVTVVYNKISFGAGVCAGGAASTSNLFSIVVKNSGGTTLATVTPNVPCGSGIAVVDIPIGYTFAVGTGYSLEFVAGSAAHSYVYFQNGANYTTVPECSWINYVGSPSGDTDDWPPFYNWRLRTGSNSCGRTPVQAYDNCFLPVDFLSFEAKAADEKVYLLWTTTQEINTSHFIVQRSSDGFNFEQIGMLYSSQDVRYMFIDENPLTGIAYYRIVEVDKDGNFSYSSIETVSGVAFNTVAYPNPFTDEITIVVGYEAELEYTMIVTDITGRELYQGNHFTNQKILMGEEYSTGMYLVKIISNYQTYVLKVYKK